MTYIMVQRNGNYGAARQGARRHIRRSIKGLKRVA